MIKIIDKRLPNVVRIGSISDGEPFFYKERLFIKTGNLAARPFAELHTIVNWMDNDTQVIPVNIEVIILPKSN